MSWQDMLKPSRQITTHKGDAWVPTRNDYLEALISEGLIADPCDLSSNAELAIEVHRHWISTYPEVGCIFARAINRLPNHYRVMAAVIPDHQYSSLDDLALSITATVEEAESAEDVEAISVILPTLTDMKSLSSLIRALGKLDKWVMRFDVPPPYIDPDSLECYVLVGLDFLLEGDIPSAVLGIGPAEEFAMTRRGPLTSLEVRVNTDGADDNKKPEKRPSVSRVSHLAQIPYNPPPNVLATKSEPAWRETSNLRLAVLGKDDPRGKADVTFTFPLWAWGS